MKSAKRNLLFFVEIAIILVIAGCMMFLNVFMEHKIAELQQAAQDAIFVMEEMNYPGENILMEDIKEHIPSTYKMIELYDENFEILFQVQFSDQTMPMQSIQDNPDLMDLLSSSKEGQTAFKVGNIEQNVYFRWLTNSNDESRLIIIYSTVADVQNLWVFSLVTYIVIILAFSLLLMMRCKSHYVALDNYRDVSKMMNDDMR